MKAVKDRGAGLAPYVYDPAELARLYRRLPQAIIADLALLCFADTPTYASDPRDSARNDGRRDVWLHINNYLKLSPKQLEAIFEGRGSAIYQEDE